MRTAVRDLKPGAVLAEAVNGPGGRQLATAGTALTLQHLQVLRVWGIDSVDIAETKPVQDNKALILAAQRAAATRFRGQPVEHPAIRALFQAAVVRHLRTRT
jgi:hypothetical protein